MGRKGSSGGAIKPDKPKQQYGGGATLDADSVRSAKFKSINSLRTTNTPSHMAPKATEVGITATVGKQIRPLPPIEQYNIYSNAYA